MPNPSLAVVALALAAAGTLACSDSGSKNCAANPAGYAPQILASNFPGSTTIDNKFHPLVPGTTYKFVESNGSYVETTVTSMTKTILGVTNVVVHDVAKLADGTVVEDTYDWYAQDKDGNVWYFGEDTTAYVGTMMSKAGSWEAGVNCAHPGMLMKASPKVNDRYYQEYLQGQAEDQAEVLSLTESVTTPYGSFQNCIKTKDYSALEPGKWEHKIYCEGIGLTSVTDYNAMGKIGGEDLVSINGGTSDGGGGD